MVVHLSFFLCSQRSITPSPEISALLRSAIAKGIGGKGRLGSVGRQRV
jgi:hypothetical protein